MNKFLSSLLKKVGLAPTTKSSLFYKALTEIVEGRLVLAEEETYALLMNSLYKPDHNDDTVDRSYEVKFADYKEGGERVFFKPYQRVGSSMIGRLRDFSITFTKKGFIVASSTVIYVKDYHLNGNIVDLPVIYIQFDNSMLSTVSLGGEFTVAFGSGSKVFTIDLGWKGDL